MLSNSPSDVSLENIDSMYFQYAFRSSDCTFLFISGCVYTYFAKAESAFWNARFKTPIQNAVHGSTVYASLEKKTISWACTAHCSRLLFELKWTGKAFIWRHLNVVICDFAFMLPPESVFCSNHDRKRTFLGVFESAFWNDVYSKISMDATAFCSNPRLKTLILASKS